MCIRDRSRAWAREQIRVMDSMRQRAEQINPPWTGDELIELNELYQEGNSYTSQIKKMDMDRLYADLGPQLSSQFYQSHQAMISAINSRIHAVIAKKAKQPKRPKPMITRRYLENRLQQQRKQTASCSRHCKFVESSCQRSCPLDNANYCLRRCSFHANFCYQKCH